MKKIFLILFSFVFLFSLVSCSKKENKVSTNEIVASKISSIENINSYSDETIKALSVLFRTNANNSSSFASKNISERILDLVNSTKNETFSSEKIKNNIFYETTSEWTKEIKKSDLLKNLADNEIYLTSVSKIEPVITDSIKTTSFDINEKNVSFDTLNNLYSFRSDYIKDIQINDDSFVFIGKGSGRMFEGINLETSEKLSCSGKNYTEILYNFDENGTLFN